MKKNCRWILAMLLASAMFLTSCGGSQEGTAKNTDQASSEEKTSSGNKSSDKAEKSEKEENSEDALLKKYEELLYDLENKDYDSALKYVNTLKAEARREANENADDQPLLDAVTGTYTDKNRTVSITLKDTYMMEYNGEEYFYEHEGQLIDTLSQIEQKKDFSLMWQKDENSWSGLEFFYNESLDAYTFKFYDESSSLTMIPEDRLDSFLQPIMDVITGTYITTSKDEEGTVTINADHTADFYGQTMYWQFDNYTSYHARIQDHENFYIYVSDDKDEENDPYSCSFNYSEALNDYALTASINDNYLYLAPEDSVEAVEITLDNYADYFEIKPYMQCNTNSFGEITSVYVGQQFVLKDDVPFYAGNGAIELSYTNYERSVISYDLDTMTFELGEETEYSKTYYSHTPQSTTGSLRTLYYGNSDEDRKFGTHLDDNYIDKDKMTVRFPEYEIVRIQGTLYLIKN